jgi:hypothetical protein
MLQTIFKVLAVAEFLLECLIVLLLPPMIVWLLIYYIGRKFIKSEKAEQDFEFRMRYIVSPFAHLSD